MNGKESTILWFWKVGEDQTAAKYTKPLKSHSELLIPEMPKHKKLKSLFEKSFSNASCGEAAYSECDLWSRGLFQTLLAKN